MGRQTIYVDVVCVADRTQEGRDYRWGSRWGRIQSLWPVLCWVMTRDWRAPRNRCRTLKCAGGVAAFRLASKAGATAVLRFHRLQQPVGRVCVVEISCRAFFVPPFSIVSRNLSWRLSWLFARAPFSTAFESRF
ncbi:hypothetical protein K491DRAFT_309052 [Lophiostoma macrostomum CBS 122681]|uniref:Uncharacterized protein n=1 Tax=Lophiostoma macrostomum CBS 122681 TaxID=1314788 RepID=A0A6A6SKH4_9PLEO|nr:hypothetical protein K491DRAFT_309052 [Lophiostoma macrostomum CBS 122681]